MVATHTLTAPSLSSDKDTGQDSKVPYTASKYARTTAPITATFGLGPAAGKEKLASRPMRLLRPSVTGFRPLCRSGGCSMEDLYMLSLHPELERVCSLQSRLHLESATSTRSRATDWFHRIFQEPRISIYELAFQAGEAQYHNPFGC